MKVWGVAAAFLKMEHEDKYLLLKRSATAKHFPDVWCGVGGGIEGDEFSEPKKAVIREIYEETGIEENYIVNLRLKYIRVNKHTDHMEGISYLYVYFAEATKTDIWQTHEGTLEWIPREELFDREFSPMESLLRHYFSEGMNTDNLYVCTTYNGIYTITPFNQWLR